MPVAHTLHRVLSLLGILMLAGCLGSGGDKANPVSQNDAALNANVTAISAGYRHACALSADGAVQCWGDNTAGQLGDGTTKDSFIPVDVTGLSSGITAISSGLNFTCALTTGGGVQCLGGNERGQLGDGTNINSSVPVNVAGLASGISTLSAGMNFLCALTGAGGVKCLGDNRVGELGDGTTVDAYSAVDVFGLSSGITAISAGENLACAVTAAGAVQCWGDNTYGELGSGATPNSNIPGDITGLTTGIIAVSAGVNFVCTLNTANGVQCVGNNALGQLGDGTTNSNLLPVNVVGLTSGVAAVSAGGKSACALTTTGGVKCWGDNTYGELGNGSTSSSSFAVNVTGLTSGVTTISTGVDFACALTGAGAVLCWGNNNAGQLGNGKDANSTIPVAVTGLSSGVIAISAGHNFTCALTAAGAVKCWGDGSYGELGNGAAVTSNLPVDVTGLAGGVTAISTGYLHACALTASGGVQCWGYNGQGQLGDGTITNSTAPVSVTGLASGVTAIAAGNLHSCALTAGGGVKCWGDGVYGELGNGTNDSSSIPVDVTGLTSGVAAISLSLGQNSACALTAAGGVQCWGDPSLYIFAQSTSAKSTSPFAIRGLESGIASVSVGTHHVCALTTGGGVRCWGNGSAGQLGNGTTGPYYTVPDGSAAGYSPLPVNVTGLSSGVASVSAGRDFTCVLTTNGGVQCWGNNSRGQLGDGTTTSSSVPLTVSGLSSGVTAIAVGGTFACALTSTAKVKCWGDNVFGQLGNTSSDAKLSSPIPVDVM